MTDITLVYDATGSNIAHLPPGQAAGYATGTGVVPWTAADWAAHPGAVRIDQDAAASDRTADVLDVETGAATIADCAPWAKSALADWRAGTRPGQRTPAIYASEASVTPVANALNAGGVTSGVGLWIANWNLDQAQAEALVTGASGPFPVIGVQFRDAGAYDVSVMSTAWLGSAFRGPYRHVTPYEGASTLAGIAAKRATTAAHLIQVTAGAMTAAEAEAAGRIPLPAGTVFYTSSP